VWYWNLIGTVVSFGKFVTEAITTKNGNVLLICLAQLPADLVPKIQGGLLGTADLGNRRE
jgi:hypothetical protein